MKIVATVSFLSDRFDTSVSTGDCTQNQKYSDVHVVAANTGKKHRGRTPITIWKLLDLQCNVHFLLALTKFEDS